MKMSSSIGWRGAWRNPCLNLRVWLRQSNKMVDLRKTTPDWKKNPASRSNQEQGMDKSIKRLKVVESKPIAIGVEARSDACVKNPIEKGVICAGKKVYRPILPYTYRETKLSDYLNDRMEWVFRCYGRYLKQEKYLLPPRDDVMEVDVQNNTEELDKNLKL